jgi:NADPH:quinone reductase-like Zn-dependent oxidoreductase
VRAVDLRCPSSLGSNALRLRMLRSPINPADLLAVDGRYAFPAVPGEPLGAEGVGVVEVAGSAVEAVEVGDLVLPLTRGNWCRRRIVEETDVVVLPAGIDLDQASMLRINPLAARLLVEETGLKAGDTLVQNAAGSAVARWVRHFAARNGIAVVDVVARANNDLPLSLIDSPDLAEEVIATNSGRPVEAALDCVAGEATGRLAACLATGGRLIVFGHLSGAPLSVSSQLMTGRGLSLVGFSLRPREASLGRREVHRMFAELFSETSTLPQAPVRCVFPLSRIDDALAAARASGRGRVLLDPSA